MKSVWAFSASLAVLATSAAHAQAPAEVQPSKWVQEYTSAKPSRDVHFGRLPNGVRYAIVRSRFAGDGVAMRFRIGSGSLAEKDGEQGFAHFVEHMAFRGSQNIPDGDTVKMLQREGLRFGADTNAFTGHDQTVYTFNFPKGGSQSLETGFKIFREIGDRLTFVDAAVSAEKGVILSEERVRDTAAYEATKQDFANTLAGSLAIERWPIGLKNVISSASAQRLKAFYRANYQPGNATIIVAGDIDVAAAEAEIVKVFGDWQGQTLVPEPAVGTAVPAHAVAEFVAKGAPQQWELAWVGAPDRRVETEQVDREDAMRALALTLANQKLSELSSANGSPVVGAMAAMDTDLLGSASLAHISFRADEGNWKEAVSQVLGVQRSLVAGNFDRAAISRAVKTLKLGLSQAAEREQSRRGFELADGLVDSVNRNRVYSDPSQDQSQAAPWLDSATHDQITVALAKVFGGRGPVVFRSGERAPLGRVVMKSALTDALAAPVEQGKAEAEIEWPYTDFGPAGKVVLRVDDIALGASFVRFGNGTRLVVRSARQEAGKVLVSAWMGNGRAGAREDLVHAIWATLLMPLGGTGKIAYPDLDKWSEGSGRSLDVSLKAAASAYRLEGTTRALDLPVELQVLNAFARDPGFRDEEMKKAASVGPMMADQIAGTASSVFMRGVQAVMSGGTSRFVELPTRRDVELTKQQDVPLLLSDSLAGAGDIAIVGDVSVDAAIDAVAKTFGAGETRPSVAAKAVRFVPPVPRGEPYIFEHSGRGDQAYLGEFWLLPDYLANPQVNYAASVAAAIIQQRLIDTVRERLGITYSPLAKAYSSLEMPQNSYLGAAIETPARNFGAFRDILNEVVRQIAEKPVGNDELERAKRPLVEAHEKMLQTDEFWAATLPLTLRDPKVRKAILDEGTGLNGVTAGDVWAFARKYVAGQRPVFIVARASAPGAN